MYYVVMPISNRIVIISHVWSLFCQLPSCNLFTQHVICLCGETPLVNCGPRSSFFYILTIIYCKRMFCLFSAITVFFYCKHIFPLDTFNPLFSAKPVRLTTSLEVGAKYFGCVVCRFHVVADAGSAPCQKSASNTFGSDLLLLLVD